MFAFNGVSVSITLSYQHRILEQIRPLDPGWRCVCNTELSFVQLSHDQPIIGECRTSWNLISVRALVSGIDNDCSLAVDH